MLMLSVAAARFAAGSGELIVCQLYARAVLSLSCR